LPVGIFPGSVGRQQDAFRQNFAGFVTVILGFLVVFAEQLFAALVCSSGNGRLAFAALPVGDLKMGARDGCIISFVFFYGVAGFPGAGACSC